MIPLLALVRWRQPGGRRRSLWLPLFLLWLLLLPLMLVLLPFVIVLLVLAGGKPFRTLGALWSVLAALKGTRVDIDTAGRVFILQIF